MASSPVTTPPTEDVKVLSTQTKAWPPRVNERQPFVFLSLAPATSAAYPHRRGSNPRVVDAVPTAAITDEAKRRSSSSASEGPAASVRARVLKLGPVHGGEHLDDHQGDWHEVAIE